MEQITKTPIESEVDSSKKGYEGFVHIKLPSDLKAKMKVACKTCGLTLPEYILVILKKHLCRK